MKMVDNENGQSYDIFPRNDRSELRNRTTKQKEVIKLTDQKYLQISVFWGDFQSFYADFFILLGIFYFFIRFLIFLGIFHILGIFFYAGPTDEISAEKSNYADTGQWVIFIWNNF